MTKGIPAPTYEQELRAKISKMALYKMAEFDLREVWLLFQATGEYGNFDIG